MTIRIDDGAEQVFEASIARSRKLQKLYHGLVNTRARGMRSDWAEKFEDLMRWNRGHADARVDSNEAVIVIRSGASLAAADFSAEEMKDLLRGALVMAVSAMDAYFHRKIKCYVARLAKKGDDAPGALRACEITLVDFASAIESERPWGKFGAVVGRKLGYQSLQSPAKIETGLQLLGVKSFWKEVGKKLNVEPDALKFQLDGIVKRRNEIAHEGDVSTARKTLGRTRDISPQFVQESIDLIESIVMAADDVINERLRQY